MAGVLHLPAGGQALEAGLQARSAALRDLGGPGVTLDASDKVWADPTLPTERTYLNAIATGYDAGLATALDPIETSPDPFTTAAGRQVTAQFMIGGPYRAVSAGGWTAVQLPYRGGKLDMEALLPPAGAGGCALHRAVAPGMLYHPGGARRHPGDRRERHGGQRRDCGRRGGDRGAGAAASGPVQPALPDGGDRPHDRRALFMARVTNPTTR
jgi:hypothetical protein